MRGFITLALFLMLAQPAFAEGGLGTKPAARTAPAKVNDASLDYLIGQAGRLAQGDQQQQLAALRQQIQILRQQEQALRQQIQLKQQQLAGEEIAEKREHLQRQINTLETQLHQTEARRRQIEAEVQEIANRERRSPPVHANTKVLRPATTTTLPCPGAGCPQLQAQQPAR